MGHDIEAVKLFKKIVEDSRNIRFTPHAQKEISKDNLTYKQVIEVIKKGVVTEGPYQERGNWKANFQKVVAGDLITVVAALNSDLNKVIIVTAWLNKR